MFARDDVDDNFKTLFALHNGLTRLQELTAFAQTSDADSSRIVLERQFQRLVDEAESFVNDARFRDISLIFGLKSDTIKSTVLLPRSSNSTVLFNAPVSTVRADPIPGLTGTETFTIAVTRGGTTTNVAIDLSLVGGPLNVDNITSFINGELLTAGFATSFLTERFSESSYGFRINVATGEEISFSTGTASESSAIYVAATSGATTFGSAFLTKIDDLAAADLSQGFRSNIDSPDAPDRTNAVAVDSEGNLIVVGTTAGNLDGQINADGNDVYLQKFDHAGTLIFSRLLGSSEDAAGFAATVDSSDNIIVAGQVFGQLTSSGFGGNYDTFVTKFNESGQGQFTRQAAPFANDGAFGLAVNSSDEIFVTGFTNAAGGSGLTHGGGTDGFVTKINSSGTLLYNKQFGGTGNEVATAIAISDVGEILVAGTVDGNGFLRKFADDSTNDPAIYNIDLGALGTGGDVTGVATNSQGEIFVSGVTTNAALSGTVIGAHSGNTDAFLIRLTESGGGAATTASDSLGITVNAVNDPPTIANPGTQTVAIDTDLAITGYSIADVDAASGNLEVTLTVNDGALTLSQTTGLSFTTGDGTSDTTMTFQGTLSDINSALNGLVYRGDVAFNGTDSIAVTVDDLGNTGSGGAQTANDAVTVEVGAINRTPSITVPGTQTLPFFADLTIPGISISDSDVGASNLEVTLTGTGGTVSLSQITGLAFSVGDGTADATMTFQGSLTDVNAAIDNLIYSSSDFFGGDTGSVTIGVSDLGNTGAGGAQTDNASITITDVINSAPAITVPGAQTAAEDTSLAISGVSIADTDSAASSLEVTLGVTNGTVTLGQTTGLTFSTGDGTADATMTFQGTLTDINSALAALSYLGGSEFSGGDTLSVDVSDLGNTGSTAGGTNAAVDYVTYVGTANEDRGLGLAIDRTTDDVYLTGSTTGVFTGEVSSAATDAFAAKVDRTGSLIWTHQFGGAFNNSGNAIAFDAGGTSVLSRLGLPNGPGKGLSATTVTAETSVRDGQFFSIGINGAEPRQVTIEEDDSFGFLVFRINQILGNEGRAEIDETIDGERLEITARNGSILEFLPGSDNFDALAGLGLTPARLFGDPADVTEAEAFSDSAFALGFIEDLNVLTREAAIDANIIVENALRVIRESFTFITEGPTPPPPGQASTATLNQLANYELAVARLQQPATLGAVLGIF